MVAKISLVPFNISLIWKIGFMKRWWCYETSERKLFCSTKVWK